MKHNEDKTDSLIIGTPVQLKKINKFVTQKKNGSCEIRLRIVVLCLTKK